MSITPYSRISAKPLTQITPFTYRDGATFQELINDIELWLTGLAPELTSILEVKLNEFRQEIDEVKNDIEVTKDQWVDKFDQFMLDIIQELEGLNDQSMANLIGNELSKTRVEIDSLFSAHHDSEFFVDIAEFGAKQDESDSSNAIILANAVALARGKTLVASGIYTIKNMVIITADCDFTSAQFNCDLEGVAFEVTSVRRKHLFGDIVNARKLPGGWASVTNSVGLRVRNCNTSTIGYQFIRNFEHGLSVFGDSGGSAYNTFHCGALWHNKVNLVLESRSNTGTGYANQNTFIGGRFAHETSDSGENATGVKHVWFRGGISPDDGGRSNNNLFLNSSFEGVAPEYTIDFDRASVNQMLNCRYEFGNKIIFREFARDNNLYGGFGLAEITKDVVNQGIRNRWTSTVEDVTHAVFERKWANISSHTFPWYVADWSNRSIALGNGSSEPMKIRAITSSSMTVDGSFHPELGDTYDSGTNTRRWRNFLTNTLNLIDRIVVFPRSGHPPVTPSGASVYLLKNPSGSHRLMCQLPDGTTHMIAGQSA